MPERSVYMDYSNIRDDDYMVQGYVKVDNITIISAYKRNCKSRLYFYRNNKLDDVMILSSKAHVGGLSYDKENNLLFVTNTNGRVDTFDYKTKKSIENDITISNYTDRNMATITVYNGKLYASTFGIRSYLYEIEYDYNKKFISMKNIKKLYNIGPAVQGINFYNHNNHLYLVTSSSLGIDSISKLNVYYVLSKPYHVNSIKIKHSGLEGIYTDEDGNISGIYEFGKQVSEDFGNIDDFINMRSFTSNKSLLLYLGIMKWDYKRKRRR